MALPDTADAEPPVRRPRDPDRTKRDILVAAREEFVEHGLDGARVDRIAERAGANKRMLYHYVGNKEALYARVLLEAYREIRDGEAALHLGELPPAQAMEKLVGFTFDHFREHPWFLRLLATENIQRGRLHQRDPGDPRAALAAGRPDPRGARRRRGDGHLPRRRRSGAALHHRRRHQLFLHVEHPHPLGDLRRPPRRRGRRWPRRRAHGIAVVLGYLRPGMVRA